MRHSEAVQDGALGGKEREADEEAQTGAGAAALPGMGSARACMHTLRVGILCALCGESMEDDPNLVVAALHTSDELLQTTSSAVAAQRAKNELLDRQHKLILILDLDQTILHTTTSEAPCDAKFAIGRSMFYVKYRPSLVEFLSKVKGLFEIHVYTMGAREYAAEVCRFIDPTGGLFEGRIVSRCENFNELTKSLERISCIDRNVVILDDRIDVWNYSPNLVPVRPFWHYNHLDINDPQLIAMRREAGMDEADLSDVADGLPGASSLESELSDLSVPDRGDGELSRLYDYLKEIHRLYFSTRLSVPKIIRLNLLQGMVFISSPAYVPLVELLGGTTEGAKPQLAIEDAYGARFFKTLNVRAEWLYESLYSRMLVDVNDFVIEACREAPPADEYENELLEEFFRE